MLNNFGKLKLSFEQHQVHSFHINMINGGLYNILQPNWKFGVKKPKIFVNRRNAMDPF